MLHLKLNSAVSALAVAAAFSVLLPPSNAYCGVCFLPDCGDEDGVFPGPNPNPNSDTEWCEKKGYTYYASGKCPQYQALVSKCKRDDFYLKCDDVTWCKQNGYNTTSCPIPSYLDGQCPNGKPYYKQCKEDRPRACREAGYVNSCSPGRLYATTNRCPYDKSFGKCCTASPSAGCPSSYAVTCDPARGSSGTDTCGYTCYRCCSDECSRGSKNYTGSYAGTTECGSTCRYCKDCTSGSTSYSGSYVGSSECGNCYSCSDNCRSGQKSVSCSSTYNKVRVSSTECGTSCYECQYNSDCSVTSKSCSYGCASTNSCGKCTSCNSTPPHSHSYSCPSGYSTSCSNGYSDTSSKTCSCGSSSGTCYKCCPQIQRRSPAQENDAGWITSNCFALAWKAYGQTRYSESDCPNSNWHIPSSVELKRFGYFHREYTWISDNGCPAGQHKYQYTNNETNTIEYGCHAPEDTTKSIHTRCVRQF